MTTDERLDRLERAVRTMAYWLVQAQTGFGERDLRGIEKILDGEGRSSSEDSKP